jgi:hypothetical protein
MSVRAESMGGAINRVVFRSCPRHGSRGSRFISTSIVVASKAYIELLVSRVSYRDRSQYTNSIRHGITPKLASSHDGRATQPARPPALPARRQMRRLCRPLVRTFSNLFPPGPP